MECWHGKRHDEGTTDSASQDSGERYSSHVVSLRDGVNEMMNPSINGPSIAVQV